MSLARRHKERILAAQSAASAPNGGAAAAPAATLPAGAAKPSQADVAARQIGLRLTHDLRRLKEIRSIDMKIAAKREMIPEYRDWVRGLLLADAGVGTGLAAEVLPTMMVWCIDIAEYHDGLDLAEFALRHHVAMPARYKRDAATIIVEEIADAALKVQGLGEPFPPSILVRVEDMTAHIDLHDEVRAKLMKAIGIEYLRDAEEMEATAALPRLQAALTSLNEAQRLNARVGVKDKIKRAAKLQAATLAAVAPANEPGAAPDQGAGT